MKTLMHEYVKGSNRICLQYCDSHYYVFVSELRKSAKYPKTIEGLDEAVRFFKFQAMMMDLEN